MKHYVRIIFSVLFVFFSFGVVLPRLISYPDTVVVLSAIGYGFFVLPGVLYVVNYPYIKKFMKE